MMKNMVEIDLVIDEKYKDPKVTIQTRSKTKQIENIVYAIENASDNDFPQIIAYDGDNMTFISQRDIIRALVDKRRVILETEEGTFIVKKTLTSLEEDLNKKRFVRLSQSEIINIYKVKCFNLSFSGTISVELDNGTKSWASRSNVKNIKNLLKELGD